MKETCANHEKCNINLRNVVKNSIITSMCSTMPCTLFHLLFILHYFKINFWKFLSSIIIRKGSINRHRNSLSKTDPAPTVMWQLRNLHCFHTFYLLKSQMKYCITHTPKAGNNNTMHKKSTWGLVLFGTDPCGVWSCLQCLKLLSMPCTVVPPVGHFRSLSSNIIIFYASSHAHSLYNH